MTHKEDFTTGSTAAVCGGITTVIDMPNTVPPNDNRAVSELTMTRTITIANAIRNDG